MDRERTEETWFTLTRNCFLLAETKSDIEFRGESDSGTEVRVILPIGTTELKEALEKL